MFLCTDMKTLELLKIMYELYVNVLSFQLSKLKNSFLQLTSVNWIPCVIKVKSITLKLMNSWLTSRTFTNSGSPADLLGWREEL